MGIKQWAAGIIRKTPVTPAGPYQDSAASGIWTLDQVVYWLKQNLWPVAGNTNPSAFVENLFSTYLYTGNGSTQTITNGIDLSTYGGLVWSKDRGFSAGQVWYDTARGAYPTASYINSASTEAASLANGGAFANITGFNSNGYTIGSTSSTNIINYSGSPYVSWTFRKQPKFFDVVTYTGNGVAGRQIAHSLGATPGVIIVKSTSNATAWAVYHRSLNITGGHALMLNTIDASALLPTFFNSTLATDTTFTVGNAQATNQNNLQYVAYLFAHNAGGFGLSGTENVISCGSFTTDGSVNASVNLGWEPQWLIIKNTTSADNWWIVDNMRGYTANDSGNTNPLVADTPNAELSNYPRTKPTSTGFVVPGTGLEPNKTYIYIAIRRGPMQVPTDGTKVFAPWAQTGEAAFNNSFPVDLVMERDRTSSAFGYTADRLRGGDPTLSTTSPAAEFSAGPAYFDSASGTFRATFVGGASPSVVYENFGRAPGFFDVVCYTGDGTFGNIAHNLTVVPELIINKRRDAVRDWYVDRPNGNGYTGFLNSSNAWIANWGTGNPTATYAVFQKTQDTSGATYVSYLFATCPGVSKVGSYTGNGSSQTLNCGFTAGARFVLIKRTDSTGDWYVWDSARGIVAGTDPHLSLNTTAAEVTTDDSVDADSTGFIVNQLSATNVNVTSATYIYLAIA